MKRLLYFPLIALLASCGQTKNADFIVTVANDQGFDREELVEVPISAIAGQVRLIDEEQYIVLDAKGDQVPYQITYDDNLLFPVAIGAGAEVAYTITTGNPIKVESCVYGRHFPEHFDDVTWENDRSSYRAFGPASQAQGGRDYGYDVWVKRVSEQVIEQRYAKELNPETAAEMARLRKSHKYKEANELYRSVSYKVDHGDGLDCYAVGPTLGCGTAVLMKDNDILYPHCWKEHEIMEDGPYRFTVKLTYNPIVVGRDSVTETRIISLDKGSQLNKTVVTYAGLNSMMPVATGLAVRKSNPYAYVLEGEKGYIAYADLTDDVGNGNGVIYTGAVMSQKVREAKPVMFSDKEAKERGALGHVLAISNYKPESEYVYYWGAGWSKYGYLTMESWTAYLERYAQRVRNPLKVVY